MEGLVQTEYLLHFIEGCGLADFSSKQLYNFYSEMP